MFKVLGILCSVMLLACSADESEEESTVESNEVHTEDEHVSKEKADSSMIEKVEKKQAFLNGDTTILLSYMGHEVSVSVKVPKDQTEGIKSVLLLHGWNLPPNEWCEKTELCEELLMHGYHIITPNFGKSTYHWELYPETIENYRKFPSRKWMFEVFMTHIQDSLGLLRNDQSNSVVGLSTGGRGAALFALENPETFNSCVALSADFDHSKISDEPINNGFYGSIKEFPERWTGKDNIYNRAEEWKVPLYLGHGKQDKMCPVSQTQEFYKKLQELSFEDVVLSLPDSHGHDYTYWSYETQSIIDFLIKYE